MLYARRTNVLQFVRDTEAVIQHIKESGSGAPLTHLTPMQKALLDRPDSRLCAREDTPSRRHFCGRVDKTFMRSKQGLFSAFVYRFMYFDSAAFTKYSGKTENCKFFSMDDWKKYYDDLRREFPSQGEDFFCNPKNSGKPVEEYVSRYWKTCNDFSLVGDLQWPLGFRDVGDKLVEWRTRDLLPGFDEEDIYQLCVDMVYYDLVSPPSVDDVVETIMRVNGNSVGGLVVLGYLDASKEHSFSELKAAFCEFYDDIYILSVADGMNSVNVDVIQVENILCCFHRLWSTGYYHNNLPLPFQIR